MVLLGRIELPTSALPRMRSTTELQQHTTVIAGATSAAAEARYWPGIEGMSSALAAFFCKGRLKSGAAFAKHGAQDETRPMSNTEKPANSGSSREERLAAKLRENLRRRKAQSRAIEDTQTQSTDSQG